MNGYQKFIKEFEDLILSVSDSEYPCFNLEKLYDGSYEAYETGKIFDMFIKLNSEKAILESKIHDLELNYQKSKCCGNCRNGDHGEPGYDDNCDHCNEDKKYWVSY